MESMRDELIEAAARALYEQFAADDFDNTYCSWDLLLGKHEWRQRAEPALDAILERMKEPILAVIDARVEMYEKKAEASDPLAPDDCNSHERRKDHALAVEYLKPEMEAMLATLSPPPALT